MSLLYRGSRDGFKDYDFNNKCGDKGPTLTLIKSVNSKHEVFGGFTDINWKKYPQYDSFE